MGLQHSYTALSPLYDLLVDFPTRGMRRQSLARVSLLPNQHVLLCGVGTGLDIPLLPVGPHYHGVDLTRAMLRRAKQRTGQHALSMNLVCADAMRLPYRDASMDTVIMHLILAVVPQPHLALQEACRVLAPGGHLLILDKFLRPGQKAPMRRLISPLLRHVATRTDVVFEHLLTRCPELRLTLDEAAAPGGWFRHLLLNKKEG